MLIVADDPEAFILQVRQGAAQSQNLAKLANALGRTVFVLKESDLRQKGLVSGSGVVSTRALLVDQFGDSAVDRPFEILTVNPMLWDLTGLKETVVQFILWVTKGVTINASPAMAMQFIEDHRQFVTQQ
jgi:hypothetical protein